MTDAMIVTEGLSKNFNGLWAVRELDLKISRGEVFAFLGPNGAGKTTTIRLLTGLLRPTEGKAFIDGLNVHTHYIDAKKRLGFIPDHPYLYEKLTGRDFLFFVGDLFKVPRKKQIERMEKYFVYFEFQNMADNLIENFSHGMRQKLVFAATMLHEPEVFVIDEPMVGLDPRSVKKVKTLLKERALQGATVFLSTHSLAVADEVADRIGIINKGKLIFLGNVEELKMKLEHDGTLEELFLKLIEEESE